MPAERPEGVWSEIERLRDHWHNKIQPELAAHAKLLESYGGRLQTLERAVSGLEEEVERMASQAKIQAAVSAALRQEHGKWLTGWQKVGATLVGLAALGAFALQLYNAATGT